MIFHKPYYNLGRSPEIPSFVSSSRAGEAAGEVGAEAGQPFRSLVGQRLGAGPPELLDLLLRKHDARVPASRSILRGPGPRGRRPEGDPNPLDVQVPAALQDAEDVALHIDDLLGGMRRRRGNPQFSVLQLVGGRETGPDGPDDRRPVPRYILQPFDPLVSPGDHPLQKLLQGRHPFQA